MLCFYGIIAKPGSPAETLKSGEWFIVEHEEIAAVVHETDETVYLPTRESVMKHQSVINDVMKSRTIIPARFGTIFSSSEDVKLFLAKTYDHALEMLEILDQKIEVGLKAFWKDESFQKMIDTPAVRELKRKIERSGNQDTRFLELQLGELVKALVDTRREEYTGMVHESLRKLVFSDMVKEATDVKMAFNFVYLLQRDRLDDFSKQVDRVTRGLTGELNVSYTGPWPPYNFCMMKVNIEETQAPED